MRRRTFSMKKMTTTLSALTIAAALMMNLTACTNDDNIATTPEQPETVSQQTTVHVTVGAGIGDDDGTTRAAVTQEGTTRTLTFTAGDRLYVTVYLGGSPTKYLAGYLDIVGTPAEGATSATFSGDLSVYLNDGTPSTYDFGDADPLTVDVPTAKLVPADAPAGFILEKRFIAPFNDAKMIAADVNTLMASALYVSGVYDSSTNSFSLSGEKPILNCTIGNLKKNTEYTVKLRYAMNQSDYESNTKVSETTYDAMTVTSDNYGIARFAISGLTDNFADTYNFYYALQLVPVSGATKTYVLGQKDLGAKVYNVNRDLYGTCRLTVQMPQVPSTTYYEDCSAITVKIGDKVIYQTPSNEMMMFVNGQTTIYCQMDPIDNATLTIIGTKTTGSGTVTYTGTATGVTILSSQTTNVGPITITEKTASTVTWNFSEMSGHPDLFMGYTYKDVTLSGDGYLNISNGSLMSIGNLTFTAPAGKHFKKIVITATATGMANIDGWTNGHGNGNWTSTWTGDASSVSFSGNCDGVTSIVFTLE